MVKRKGFTLIEIALFLAVTAALFIGIALGAQNSIFQQKYNDSTQNFFEFMQSIYSKVSNPQSPGTGDSDTAIYGKLLVFGEKYDLLGEEIPDDEHPIFMYDVVGDVGTYKNVTSGDALFLLKALHVNVIRQVKISENKYEPELAMPEKYEMRWQAELQNTDNKQFTGSILVVRHPRAGTINTFYSETIINANEVLRNEKNNENGNSDVVNNLLTQYLDSFKTEEVDFCVNPYGPGESGSTPKRNIRVLSNARNASSVLMIDQDGEDNKCK